MFGTLWEISSPTVVRKPTIKIYWPDLFIYLFISYEIVCYMWNIKRSVAEWESEAF